MKTKIFKTAGLGLLAVMLLFSSFAPLSSLEKSNAHDSSTDLKVIEKVKINDDGTFELNTSGGSLLSGRSSLLRSGDTYPSSYDLRNEGVLSTVDDQGPDGLCWAYANRAVFESSLRKDGILSSERVSLNHILNSTYNINSWDSTISNMKATGGSSLFVLNGVSKMFGPAKEASFPSTSKTLGSKLQYSSLATHMALLKDMNALDLNDKNSIKKAIMEHGGLSTAILTAAYTNPIATNLYTSHAFDRYDHNVTIVGWDDNYSKSNFSSSGATPNNNGAWIIRNSWGTSGVGEAGYQYISYEDKAIDNIVYSFDFEENNNTTNTLYKYDDCGYIMSFGVGTPTVFSVANVFTAANNEVLKQASVFVENPGNYTLKIYTNVTGGPNTGTLAHTQTGTFESAGFHKVDLNSDIPLTENKKFSIIFELPNTSMVAAEGKHPSQNFSNNFILNAGESYYKVGNEVGFTDLKTKFGTNGSIGNLDIKAYTNYVAPPPSSITTLKYTVGTRIYTGGYVKPAITIKTSTGKVLKEGIDYTVKYNFNKLPGNAKVQITGKGNYFGTVNKTYRIYPKASKVAVKYVKKNVYSVSWAKSTGITKYVLYYRKGSGKWKTKIFAASKLKTTFIKLKGKYQFKIRSYKTVGSVKLYSAYSKVVTKTLK